MMRCFYYHILLPNGRTRRRVVKLAMERENSAQLHLERRWDAVVLRLIRLPAWFNVVFHGWIWLSKSAIKPADLAEFFRNLSVMLASGVPILTALEELESEDGEPQTAELARGILESLHTGASLSESLDRHADQVPESVRHLARIGEASGTLDRTLADAASHLSRVVGITKQSRRAAIYPAFVFASIFGATLFWLYYVIPSVGDLFRQMQIPLPPLTQNVIAASKLIEEHFLVLSLALMILLAAAGLALRYSVSVRHALHFCAYHLPVSRTLVRSSKLAFITEYLSLLISSGVDMSNSLKVVEDSISSEVYRRKIHSVRLGIERGNSLSNEMRRAGVFPGFVLRMVRVGEEAGTLDEQLAHLAEEYRQRFAHVVASISEIIQPVIMLIAGAFFILMVVALFLPVYQLVGQVRTH